MPGWRDLVDVQVQSLTILQLPHYLDTVPLWLTTQSPPGKRVGKVNLMSPT